MKRRVVEAWLMLLYIDLVMKFRPFRELDSFVRGPMIPVRTEEIRIPVEALCHEVDLACIFYFKPVLCLQRSVVTTVLLRRKGWNAVMIIGAQIVPFKSHAWCEIDGRVINDRPYMRDKYAVLEQY